MRKKGMFGKRAIAIATCLLLTVLAGCATSEDVAEPTTGADATVTEAPTAEPTEEPEATSAPTATVTPTPTPVPTETPEQKYWNERLQEFSDSKYDLTAALTMESLKDQCSEYFLLGAAMSGGSYNTFAIHSPEFMAVLEKHFSSTTATNLMKASYFLSQPLSKNNLAAGNPEPVIDTIKIEEALEWCMESGVKMRGHTLVWHSQTPDWFFKEGYESDGVYVDRETMLARLDSYIGQVMTFCQDNYPGVVYCWDVVNEAVDPDNGDANSPFHCRTSNSKGDDMWYVTIGADYPEQAFRIARKYAAEGVKLYYNDYGVVGGDKRQYIYNLCKDLADKGLIDGVGLQGYWGNGWPSLVTIETTIRKLAELDLEIQLTELTIEAEPVSEIGYSKQARRYAEIFQLLQRLDTQGGGPANITAVTMFGLMDGFMFNTNDENTSRWFDKDLQPKPVVDAIMEVFEEYYK